ncbi:beta-phosphoglucomutase family hydrolase [Microbacterium sp. dk485]|nr:beta-phosphoglucomutase family hydrolase [Microbacterium sp. dk485]
MRSAIPRPGPVSADYADAVTDGNPDSLPDLAAYDAVLFDLDGVLTPTAEVHMHAWRTMFEELFAQWDIRPPYTDRDYFEYLDGKKRYDGVASLLRSRDVEVPWGDPADPPTADTVCGIGNRKNVVFAAVLRSEGISPYPGSVRLVDGLLAAHVPIAVVSSSKNAEEVLEAAGIRDRFTVVMDGVVAERDHLRSKPAPDVFVEAARMLGVDPARSVAVEDALSGVQSAAAGGFAVVVGVDRGVGGENLTRAGATVVVDDLAAFVD